MESNFVTATLNYVAKNGVRPFYYGYLRKDGGPQLGGDKVSKEVKIRDGRSLDLKLDEASFQLVTQETSLSTEDFFDEDKIKDAYYPEVERLVKDKLGAEKVVVFHHQVRSEEKYNGVEGDINSTVQKYADQIHSDSHEESANGLFYYLCCSAESRYKRGRYVYLNLWRNISEEPIVDHHLAVADQRSLTTGYNSEDYVESDLYGFDPKSSYYYKIKQFGLNEANSVDHRWYYFPLMKKNEVILFKQWDSDPTKEGRMCFHTAFKDPTAPEGAKCRQSIEVRVMAFFPDHEPNTCPTGILLHLLGPMMNVMGFTRLHKTGLQALGGVAVAAVVGTLAWWLHKRLR